MPLIKQRIYCLLMLISIAINTPTARALDGDSSQPISIEADQAEQISEGEYEKITYIGNVKIVQGSMRIIGNKVVVYSRNQAVDRVVATGKPAHFEQQPANSDSLIKAKAETLDYRLQDDSIIMLNNASLSQGNSFVSGKTINFNLKTERVKAKTRVKMVLEPSKST